MQSPELVFYVYACVGILLGLAAGIGEIESDSVPAAIFLILVWPILAFVGLIFLAVGLPILIGGLIRRVFVEEKIQSFLLTFHTWLKKKGF